VVVVQANDHLSTIIEGKRKEEKEEKEEDFLGRFIIVDQL
jgi:hypothetical protein